MGTRDIALAVAALGASMSRGILDKGVANGVVVLVTLVWAASFVADVLRPDYSPPAAIHTAFLTVIGTVFGIGLAKGGS